EKPLRPRQRQGKIAGAGNPILAGLRLLLAQERSRQSRSCTPCALRRRDLEHGGSLSCAPPLTTSKRSRCAWHTSMATAPRLMNLLSKGSTLLSGMASCPTRGRGSCACSAPNVIDCGTASHEQDCRPQGQARPPRRSQAAMLQEHLHHHRRRRTRLRRLRSAWRLAQRKNYTVDRAHRDALRRAGNYHRAKGRRPHRTKLPNQAARTHL